MILQKLTLSRPKVNCNKTKYFEWKNWAVLLSQGCQMVLIPYLYGTALEFYNCQIYRLLHAVSKQFYIVK